MLYLRPSSVPVHLTLFFFRQKLPYKAFKVVVEFILIRAIKYTSAFGQGKFVRVRQPRKTWQELLANKRLNV
jgi:hypothetical protein